MFLRTITIVLLAACINAPLLADEEYTQAQINEEIAKYFRREKIGTVVRNVGLGFFGVGVTMVPIGLIAMNNASGDGGAMAGAGLALAGIPTIGFGLVVAITGGVIRLRSQKKRGDHEGMLSIRYTGNGMAVVFAF